MVSFLSQQNYTRIRPISYGHFEIIFETVSAAGIARKVTRLKPLAAVKG